MAMTQTAFRFSAEEYQLIDRIKKALGYPSRAAVIRYLLRQHAKAEGIDVAKIKRPRGRVDKKSWPV